MYEQCTGTEVLAYSRDMQPRSPTNLVPQNETASTSAFKLKSGDYLHAFHYLHHSDPNYFEEPESFKPERFLVREGGSVEVGQGTL